MQRGMTLIELVIAIAVAAVAIAASIWSIGSMGGARASQGADEVATAVRYTYNLAAINNTTYALYLNLDEGTYYAAPISQTAECDRVLLSLDGDATEGVFVQYGKSTDEDAGDSGESSDLGDVPVGGPDSGGGGGGKSDSHFSKLMNMAGGANIQMAREHASSNGKQLFMGDSDEKVDGNDAKRMKAKRKNQLSKPKKLPEGVVFGGVVLRKGMAPITEGTVPILVYPHGYTQPALIYIDETGADDDEDAITLRTIPLQGRAEVLGYEVKPDDFDTGEGE